MATICVGDDIYRELNWVVGQLRQELGHPVSMDDMVEHLLKTRGLKISDFQGAWKMSDEETRDLVKSLRGHWSPLEIALASSSP